MNVNSCDDGGGKHTRPSVAPRYLQDVFLGSVEEEDDPVAKRRGLVGQRMEDFQHHRAAHCIVTGA